MPKSTRPVVQARTICVEFHARAKPPLQTTKDVAVAWAARILQSSPLRYATGWRHIANWRVAAA